MHLLLFLCFYQKVTPYVSCQKGYVNWWGDMIGLNNGEEYMWLTIISFHSQPLHFGTKTLFLLLFVFYFFHKRNWSILTIWYFVICSLALLRNAFYNIQIYFSDSQRIYFKTWYWRTVLACCSQHNNLFIDNNTNNHSWGFRN